MGKYDMGCIESWKLHIVFQMDPDDFKPFSKIRGQFSIEPITDENIPDVSVRFSMGKVPVFYEMLHQGNHGILVRHKSEIVGYMWYKDYHAPEKIKAGGYVPLRGRFTHIHFAQVAREVRGRGLQLLMLTNLVQSAYERGISRIYTDTQQTNRVSISGIAKVGFKEVFRLVIVRLFGWTFSVKYRVDTPFSGPDTLKSIFLAELKWMVSNTRHLFKDMAFHPGKQPSQNR
jgi:GNAT superfamily N-acetyltransferase